VKGGRQHDTIVRSLKDDNGQAMAEYAFVLAMVAGAVIVVYQLFGEHVASLYDRMLAAFT
jgi:Flp pilus assembly pilin Flp